MGLRKAKNRDKKRQKRNKMRVSGRSVFLTQKILIEKSKKIKRDKKNDYF